MAAQFQILKHLVITVTTAGTPVQVSATPLYVRSYIGQAHHANSGKIFIGNSSANALSANAHALTARETFGIDGDVLKDRSLQFDLSNIWVDSDTNGSKLIVSYMQEVLGQ